MFLQVKVSAEAFPTGGTGEWLLVVVCVHVECQVVYLMERFAADGTFELLFPAVGQFMVLVVSFVDNETGGKTTQHNCLFVIVNNNRNIRSYRGGLRKLLLVMSGYSSRTGTVT